MTEKILICGNISISKKVEIMYDIIYTSADKFHATVHLERPNLIIIDARVGQNICLMNPYFKLIPTIVFIDDFSDLHNFKSYYRYNVSKSISHTEVFIDMQRAQLEYVKTLFFLKKEIEVFKKKQTNENYTELKKYYDLVCLYCEYFKKDIFEYTGILEIDGILLNALNKFCHEPNPIVGF
jgi:hypothetical protein